VTRAAVRAARPYPHDRLPRWRRGDAALLRALLRRLGAPARPAPRLDAGFEALLGGPLDARPGVPHLAEPASLLADRGGSVVCAVLSAAGGCAVVACDRPFALMLARRCLGGPDAPDDARGPLDPRWEGSLAVLAARLLARASAPAPPPVVRAVTDDLADALGALGPGPLLAWPWALSLGGDAARALCLVARDVRWDAPPADPPSPQRLGDVPVTAAVLAGRARWPAAEVASLARGEVFALDGLRLEGGAPVGDVALALGHPPALARAARLRGDGAVELAGPLEPFMEDHDDDGGARLAELPVEVAVELARERFALAEVAAWRAGEVVTFRARVGDAVTVRANGRAVARGELVDVEGDVGVRIVEVL